MFTMLKINLTEEEIKTLDLRMLPSSSPNSTKKMKVLYLRKTTLSTYLKQYQEGGIEHLKKLAYKGQPSKLLEHASSLQQYFTKHPPRTIVKTQAAIEKLTGIKRSLTQIKSF